MAPETNPAGFPHVEGVSFFRFPPRENAQDEAAGPEHNGHPGPILICRSSRTGAGRSRHFRLIPCRPCRNGSSGPQPARASRQAMSRCRCFPSSSSMIGTARRVRASRSWSEPLTLWTALVGFSGTGKTPGIDVTTRALAMVENSRRSQIAEMRRKHEARVEIAKAAAKKWKAEVQEAVEAGRRPPEMPVAATDPGPFVTATALRLRHHDRAAGRAPASQAPRTCACG